ncbi:MAG TPA: hypothetical protein VKP78_11280 [bacterium]|nr:hypothetical protein [bacterium]
MGRAELILVFGAIAIFGIFSLTILDMQIRTRISNVNRKYEDAAVSLAHSYLNMAGNEKYDERVNSDGKLPSGLSFTHVDSLGTETGEINPANYDDLDDYMDLTNDTLVVDIGGENIFNFTVNCTVYYVDHNGTEWVGSGSISDNKKIEFRLNSDYLPSEANFSRVISYR